MNQRLIELWNYHSADALLLIKDLIAATVIIVIGLILSKAAQKIIRKTSAKKFPVDETASSALRAIVRYGIYIICIIMILNIFGVNTASLLAVLGAAGVAIGLALKDTLGNIAAGIILLLMGSCRKGEYIEFGSFSGTITDINLFTMTLETPDGIYISAPNSSIWGSPLKNYTRNGKRRIDLTIGIAFTDSVDTAFQTMQNIITAETRLLNEPAPQIVLQSIEASSVKITIRAWATVQNYWDIYWDLNKIIKAKVEEAGLHVPFPQQEIHIRQPM